MATYVVQYSRQYYHIRSYVYRCRRANKIITEYSIEKIFTHQSLVRSHTTREHDGMCIFNWSSLWESTG